MKKNNPLTDEDMALPGVIVSNEKLEQWLVMDDGDGGYSSAQLKTKIKKELCEHITKVEEGNAVYLNAKEEAEKLRKKLNDL